MSSRSTRRALAVLGNSAHSLLPPFFTLALAYLVIRGHSLELWGRFVTLWIVVQLAVHIVGWGNKEYLLRAFARRPRAATTAWQSCLLSRLALLAVVAAAAVLVVDAGVPAPLLVAWALAIVLHQGFDVLVLYKRRFAEAVAVEASGFGVAALAIVAAGSRITTELLVLVFTGAALLKVIMLAALFRKAVGLAPVAATGSFDGGYFRRALPFLLLGLSGMLMSRSDLYCVAALLGPTEVGTYQILTGFLLYLQSLSALVLAPFLKGLYRLPESVLRSLSSRFLVGGLAVALAGVPALYVVLRRVYELEVSTEMMLLGGLWVVPVFGYAPLIYLAYRNHREGMIVIVNFAGVAVNVALNLLLIPRFGITGALAATAIAHWLMLALLVARDQLALRDARRGGPR
jgi:O-antigen/teichoic acid export membrane protein